MQSVSTRRRGSDEARGHPPHHRDHRRRAAQHRLLRRDAGAADGEEDGQPGRAHGLPPLLRGREGQPGGGPHVLRVSRRPPRTRGRGHGPQDRLAGRIGRGARLLGGAASRGRSRVRARRRSPALCRPGGARARAHRRDRRRPATDRRPPGGAGRVRAPGVRLRARLQRRPRAQRPLAGRPRLRPHRRRLRGAGRPARRHLALRRAARGARDRGCGHGPPHRVGLEHGRAPRLARAGDRRRRASNPRDRPLLVPLDLLPRAERSAVRDRDAGPRVRRRRGRRAPGREAHPAAVPRGSPRGDRGRAGPGPEPPRRHRR